MTVFLKIQSYFYSSSKSSVCKSNHFRITDNLSDLGNESPLSHFLTASRETVTLSCARKLNSFAMKLVEGTFL